MWTNTPKTYGRFKFKSMWPLPQTRVQECYKGWYCPFAKLGQGLLGVVSTFAAGLLYPSYQKNQTGEVLSETKYCWTVNDLDAADTDWD